MPTATPVTRPTVPSEPTRRLDIVVGSTTITNRFGVRWQELANDTGNGQFVLLRDDEQTADCLIGMMVTVKLDGDPVFCWRIDSIEDTVIDGDEESAEVIVYSGPGMAIILDEAIVYPSKGVYVVDYPPELSGLRVVTKPTSPDRYVGWMEPSYDDSGWDDATVALALGGDFRPIGFPEKSASWIWDSAPVAGEHTLGDRCYFRKTFTPASSGIFAVKIFYAALNVIRGVYLDGVLIDRTDAATDTDVGQHARAVTVQINGDLPHTLAFEVEHNVTGMAGLCYVVYEHQTATIVAKSSTTTLVRNATDEPGMTPGAIVNKLVNEAIDRGCFPDIAMSFNATDCSRPDEEWPIVEGDFALRVGDTLHDVLSQLAETYVEWGMEVGTGSYAGQLLAMWNAKDVDAPGGAAPGRGTDSGVVFAEGVNCTSLTYKETGELKTWVLWEWGDGQLDGGVDASVETYGRKESFLSIPQVKSGPSAIRTALATITPLSTPETSVVVEIQPEDTSDEPYSAFRIGDTVTAPNRAGETTDYRVNAITGQEDIDGYLTWVPELATQREIQAQTWQRWLRRTANGTLDGKSRTAQPSSPHILNAGKVNVIEISFSTAGGDEVLIGDRGTPYRPQEQMLIYRGNGEADVAGITDDTAAVVDVNGTTYETITIPVSDDTGYTDFTTTLLVDQLDLVNVEATAEGGHMGVNFTLLAVPTQ